jgi:hypothetical protein
MACRAVARRAKVGAPGIPQARDHLQPGGSKPPALLVRATGATGVVPGNGASGEILTIEGRFRPAAYKAVAACKRVSLLSHAGLLNGECGTRNEDGRRRGRLRATAWPVLRSSFPVLRSQKGGLPRTCAVFRRGKSRSFTLKVCIPNRGHEGVA